jgi:hypothetical protein
MLIIFLVACFATILGISTIFTILSATTGTVEKIKRFAERQYARVVQFVKWIAAKPIMVWPMVLGAACLAIRLGTIWCPNGILHFFWGDVVHTKVIIPLMSDIIDALIMMVRKQHPILRFFLNLVEMLVQLMFIVAVALVRMASNPDVPLIMLWVVAAPSLASVLLWTTEESLPEKWRTLIWTNKDGGERPIEGLKNKIMLTCVATLVAFVIVVIAFTKTAPTKMIFMGSIDIVGILVVVTVALIFAATILSLQVDGDTVSAASQRKIFWNEETVYTQYHYTLFVACAALASLLILMPSINTALFAHRRLTRM